jgi:hypothetical protein
MLRWKPIVVVTLISQALAVGRQFRTVLDAIMFKWKMEMVFISEIAKILELVDR